MVGTLRYSHLNGSTITLPVRKVEMSAGLARGLWGAYFGVGFSGLLAMVGGIGDRGTMVFR